ncbi:hypothetical protein FQN53_007769 [Emmonsiellopsis sp. PD_33]|nr:hypothetical protein FQN53_007769 [Emmonsiellopsis sp. PD_33]
MPTPAIPPPNATPKETHIAPLSAGARPYRSHKIRACDLCRKRKSRCTVDLPGESCLLCRVQGADCHYREDQSSTVKPELYGQGNHASKRLHVEPQVPQKRPRVHQSPPSFSGMSTSAGEVEASNQRSPPRDTIRRSNGATPALEEPLGESVHIIGPVAAEDAQVIERFMPSESSMKRPDTKAPYNVYSNDPRKPILYTTVSRRRQGLRTTGIPGDNQKEIIEQILGPFKHDLVKIFLDRINASFPIFDEYAFMESYGAENDRTLPPPLLCQVYASSLIYWQQSQILAPHPKPDIRYAINLAVAALHEEFSAPGLSTLSAALIDLTVRPIYSMTGNAINSGRTVALSHCLGLNRDPSNWKLSLAEKYQRIRLWWDGAYHLTSTATLLVRCALETSDTVIARSCLSKVDILRDALCRARLEYDWDLADMCLDHCERILTKHPGILTEDAPGADLISQTPDFPTVSLPETMTHNEIVDDMMSISGAFGTMDGFPFDMTGIWDVSGWQDEILDESNVDGVVQR